MTLPIEKVASLWQEKFGDLDFFAEHIVGVIPHKGQKKIIKTHNKFVLCTAGNRAGKTMGLTLKHLYYCIHKIGIHDLFYKDPQAWYSKQYLTINCSFEYSVAQKVFDNIVEIARNNPLFKEGGAFIKRISRLERRVEFTNGSEFRFASLEEGGKHIEGDAFYLVTPDEVGYTPNFEFIYKRVIQPRTMGVRGIVIATGTPKDIIDPFIEEQYEKSQAVKEDGCKVYPNISYINMPTSENIYLDQEDIDEMRKEYKDYPAEYAMVFEGKFVPKSTRSLTTGQISNAIDHVLDTTPRDRDGKPTKSTPIMFGTQTKIEGHKYVSAWDIAMETDWSVGITLDVTSIPFYVVNFTRVNRSNIKGWSELFDLMRREHERFGSTQYYDSTGQIGGRLQEDLRKVGLENGFEGSWAKPLMILGDKGRKKSGQIGKEELINYLTLAFSYKEPVEEDSDKLWGKVRIPNIRQLIKELGLYHPNDKKLKETDSVISLALALAVAPDPERNSTRVGYFDINPLMNQQRSYIQIA